MGICNTTGFIWYWVIYVSWQVLPVAGYGVYVFGYGVGKADLWGTRFKPYKRPNIIYKEIQVLHIREQAR